MDQRPVRREQRVLQTCQFKHCLDLVCSFRTGRMFRKGLAPVFVFRCCGLVVDPTYGGLGELVHLAEVVALPLYSGPDKPFAPWIAVTNVLPMVLHEPLGVAEVREVVPPRR